MHYKSSNQGESALQIYICNAEEICHAFIRVCYFCNAYVPCRLDLLPRRLDFCFFALDPLLCLLLQLVAYELQKYRTRINALQISSSVWEMKFVMRIYLKNKLCNAWLQYEYDTFAQDIAELLGLLVLLVYAGPRLLDLGSLPVDMHCKSRSNYRNYALTS